VLRVVNDIEAKINKNEVCQYLGYKRGRSPTPHVSSVIDSQLDEAHALIKPQACYAIEPIVGVNSSTLSVDGLVFTSRHIAPIFSGCSQAVLFLVTIGGSLERKVARLMKQGLTLESVIMDSIGSVAVEKVADWLEDLVRNIAATNGDKVGWRYSPGYCDWDITQQQELFRVFDDKSIGVNLSSACVMMPRKSISGIIGVGKSCTTSSACRFCNKKDCPTRREEFAP